MPALLKPDPAPTLIDLHGIERIEAFGLVECPADCRYGYGWVFTSTSGDVSLEPCTLCQGTGFVPGDQRDS